MVESIDIYNQLTDFFDEERRGFSGCLICVQEMRRKINKVL